AEAHAADEALHVTAGAAGTVGVRNDNVQIAADEYETVLLGVGLPPSAQGRKVRVRFGGLDGTLADEGVEFEPLADGVARTYGASLAGAAGWSGVVGSIAVELVDAAPGETLTIDRLVFRAGPVEDRDRDGVVDEYDN